jgi:hypothetical protein
MIKVRFDADEVRRIREQTSVNEVSRIAARAFENPRNISDGEIRKMAASCLSKILLIQSSQNVRKNPQRRARTGI